MVNSFYENRQHLYPIPYTQYLRSPISLINPIPLFKVNS